MEVGGLQINEEVLKEKEVFKISQVAKLVDELVNTTLDDFLTNRNWVIEEDFVRAILTGEINNENDYIAYKAVKDIHGAYQMKDTRTYSEFLRNLILGWIVEDATIEKLDGLGFNADLYEDRDKKRNIKKRVKSLPDLIIITPHNEYFVEVMQTYSDELSKKGKLRFRFRKFTNMQKYNADVLVYDLHSDDLKFVLFNVVDDVLEANEGKSVMSTKPGYLVKIDYEKHSHSIKDFELVFRERYSI